VKCKEIVLEENAFKTKIVSDTKSKLATELYVINHLKVT